LYDVSYQGIAGLNELVQRASDDIEGQRYLETLRAVEEFKLHLAKDDGLAVYGDREVKEALKMGAAKFIVVDEDRPDVDELENMAKNTGAKVYFISDSLPEGEWLRKTFNGLVGVLRYRIH
ncbi:MAG: peptide chain release factor 1, partial [Candidatus Korarchaeota archaeon]|nr:peptide chain release factor 1 [Candidatus Korarchaeota archaeon]